MEGLSLADTCKDVKVLALNLSTLQFAHSAAQLPFPEIAYTLGPEPRRCCGRDPNVETAVLQLRAQLAIAYGQLEHLAPKKPCARPCLVASCKGCFDPASVLRMRLVWDVDCVKDRSPSLPTPTPEELHAVFASWLPEWIEDGAAIAVSPCFMFVGSFADKVYSAHVYFTGYCWEPVPSNRYMNNKAALQSINDRLSKWGLIIDASISSGGVKYPCMDKWLATSHQWRGAVQDGPLGFHVRPGFEPGDWSDILVDCDPLVVPSDGCKPTSFKVPAVAVPAKRLARSVANAPRPVVVEVEGSTVQARLVQAIPQWADAVFKQTTHLATGQTVLTPKLAYCPLKKSEHGSAGKAYVLVDPLGNATVKCFICAGEKMEISGPAIRDQEEREILTHFNGRWAKLHGEWVLRKPVVLPDGTKVPLALMRQREFIAQTKLNEKKVGKLFYPQFWLGNEHAEQYPYGLMCSPDGVVPPGYYNTFCGFNPRTLQAALEFENYPEEALLPYFCYWHHLVFQNICAGDVALMDVFLDWCADMLQNPALKRGRALVLIGDPGCGKGLTVRMLLNMVGKPHAMQVGPTDLVHKFNAFLAEALLVFADESVTQKNSEAHNKLKMLITEQETMVEAKHKDLVTRQTFQHVIAASNDAQPVHLAPGERRYVIFPCAFRAQTRTQSQESGDFSLFNLVAAEVDSPRSWGALYTWLMQRDLSQVNWRKDVFTSAIWRVQYESLSPYDRWFYHLLVTEDLCAVPWLLAGDAKESYEIWFASQLDVKCDRVSDIVFNVFAHARVPSEAFFFGLEQMFPGKGLDAAQLWKHIYMYTKHFQKTQEFLRGGARRIQVVKMPSLQEARRAFLLIRGNCDERIFGEWAIL